MPEKICIIGAGSSGIVAAKVAKDRGLPFDCFEKGSGIGGNWRFRNDNRMSASYASLHINTSKSRMAYADFPMPESYPEYPHHSQVLDYFENYIDHFGLREQIRFGVEVTEVTEVTAHGGDGGDGWRVRCDDGTDQIYRAVLVANGHHWSPRLPTTFAGQFNGRTMHSHAYETPDGFEDQRVLVVGIGNSAVDIACELSRVARRVVLSTRRSAHIVPKFAWGKPIDHYTTPAASRLPLGIQRRMFEGILKLSRGSQDLLGVKSPDHNLLQAHPTISSDLLNLVGHGKIHMKPDLQRLDDHQVHFVDGSQETFDSIIFCTGYNIRFPFLAEAIIAPERNAVHLYRHVVHTERPNLFFIGLVQPLGAIMPLAEAQSEWIGDVLAGQAQLPDTKTMEAEIERDLTAIRKRYVTSDRHTIQVDFYPYLRQLQKERARQP